MPRQVQTTIDFVARKSPRAVVKCESPFAKKLEKLQLKTPTTKTPAKAVTDENCSSPALKTPSKRGVSRNLFDNKAANGENDNVSPTKLRKFASPTTKETPKKSDQIVSPYERAKYLLNSSYVEDLVHRDTECDQIRMFVEDCFKDKQASSLYISGVPGTGKTLCVGNVLGKLRKTHNFKHISINCMDCINPTAIYSKIVDAYGLKSPKTAKCNLDLIEKKIVTPSKGKVTFTVVVLDEIDKLENQNLDVLYTIFDLPRIVDSRLILIGIANTFDFTTRTLSRFHKLKVNSVIQINFHPYSKEQVKGIVESRLKQIASLEPLFNATSIELCARKVAMHSGDVRKALHVCRRAIELAENESRTNNHPRPLKTTNDDCQNLGSPRKRMNNDAAVTIKQVSVSHIMQVLNEVYGSKTSTARPDGTLLPTQQQVILCSLLLFANYRSRREVEVTKLYQIFTRVCKVKSIGFEIGNNSEFLSMCQLLETKGYVSLKSAKETSFAKISLNVNEEDIEAMMTDRNLFKSILSDSSFLKGH